MPVDACHAVCFSTVNCHYSPFTLKFEWLILLLKPHLSLQCGLVLLLCVGLIAHTGRRMWLARKEKKKQQKQQKQLEQPHKGTRRAASRSSRRDTRPGAVVGVGASAKAQTQTEPRVNGGQQLSSVSMLHI